MVGTLDVKWAPILVCSKHDWKTAAKIAYNEMVKGAVWASYDFSLLVSQQNNSNQSLIALDDELNQFNLKKVILQEQKISKSAKTLVDTQVARESDQLQEPKINMIHTTLEALLYRAERLPKQSVACRQLQVSLNEAQQAATRWLDADCQNAMEQWEYIIHPMTSGKHNIFDELYQHHEWQQLQEVRTKTTGPRSMFTKIVSPMRTATDVEGCRVANVTIDKCVQFQICLFVAETEATSWSLADIECFTGQHGRDIYGTTLNGEKQFRKKLSVCLIELEAWSKTISILVLLQVIKKCIIHFGYPCMHLVTHIFMSIWTMGGRDFLTNDSSEQLHIPNVKEACQSTNKVNYIWHVLQPNDWCTGLDYVVETQSYLTLNPGAILTLQKIITYYPLQISGKIHAAPISHFCSIVRRTPFSAP